MTRFEDAILFAVQKHSGMIRKQENIPYILHPMETAAIAGTLSNDEELLAAAVLHDTVEDTDTDIEEIEHRYGPRVAFLVASETEKKRPELAPEETWRIRKEESLEKLKTLSDPAVKILWLGDKLSNMRALFRAWKEKGDSVWENFHQKDPGQQAWYYRTIDQLLSELQDSAAWKEYHTLVETVFSEVI